MSRLGNESRSISVSDSGMLFALGLADNSIKIVRSTNFELVQHVRGLWLNKDSRMTQTSEGESVVYGGPCDEFSSTLVQFYDPESHRVTDVVKTSERNFVHSIG